LFGWEGIESVSLDDTRQSPAIAFTLTAAAKAEFAAWTTAHTGEYLAIMIDGRIALVPVINEPIPGGQVTVSSGSSDIPGRPDDAFTIGAAILVGGRLPPAWEGATVPAILTRDAAIAAARASISDGAGATVESADLDVIQGENGWEPTWTVVLNRASGPMQVIMDARIGT
jgi:hypothetical protein